MTKKEILWRHILYKALTEREFLFTQKELAKRFSVSTSTVFNALKIPRKMGAIEVSGRFFTLRGAEKLLLLWATQRNFKNDLLFSGFTDMPIQSVEGGMPPDVIFGAFSAYRLKYKEAPADYSAVYVYADNAETIKKRFSFKKGSPNLFILKPDKYLAAFGDTTPDVQTFVDLWNIPEWYAKNFLDALKNKMNLY